MKSEQTDEQVIAELAVFYAVIRTEHTAKHPPISQEGIILCRYCGGPWRRWQGSDLDGHAKCYVPLAFMVEMVRRVRFRPCVTFKALAEAMSVSVAVAREWWRCGNAVGELDDLPRDED